MGDRRKTRNGTMIIHLAHAVSEKGRLCPAWRDEGATLAPEKLSRKDMAGYHSSLPL
jgi:hypothetical protein